MKGIFTDDNFFLAFPESNSHYVDNDINGQDLQYPSFKSEDWEGLVREEFSYDRVHVMWATLSAQGVPTHLYSFESRIKQEMQQEVSLTATQLNRMEVLTINLSSQKAQYCRKRPFSR